MNVWWICRGSLCLFEEFEIVLKWCFWLFVFTGLQVKVCQRHNGWPETISNRHQDGYLALSFSWQRSFLLCPSWWRTISRQIDADRFEVNHAANEVIMRCPTLKSFLPKGDVLVPFCFKFNVTEFVKLSEFWGVSPVPFCFEFQSLRHLEDSPIFHIFRFVWRCSVILHG